MNDVRAHVFVEGRVHGVFYRASTCSKASLFSIKGWVRNCLDGRVEAVFEGTDDNVKKMINWCRSGPPGAIVKSVDVKWEKAQGDETGFDVKY